MSVKRLANEAAMALAPQAPGLVKAAVAAAPFVLPVIAPAHIMS